MIATKLTISQETRAKLLNPVLTPQKKRELREELIKDCIRKAVGGVRTKQQLICAAGFNSDAKSSDYANGFTLLNSMVKRGIISHNPTREFKKVWTIHEDVKVTPSPKEVAKALIVAPKAELVVETKPQEVVNKVKLVDMAKEFAWDNNSDSLREFIAHMEKAVK